MKIPTLHIDGAPVTISQTKRAAPGWIAVYVNGNASCHQLPEGWYRSQHGAVHTSGHHYAWLTLGAPLVPPAAIPTQYELHDGEALVTLTLTADGEDWEAYIRAPGQLPEFRYYSAPSTRADRGLLDVSRKIRREFGITGTYTPVKNANEE